MERIKRRGRDKKEAKGKEKRGRGKEKKEHKVKERRDVDSPGKEKCVGCGRNA